MPNNMGEERIDDNSEDSSYEDFKDEPENIDFNLYKYKIDCLKTEFERRFCRLNEKKINIKLI